LELFEGRLLFEDMMIFDVLLHFGDFKVDKFEVLLEILEMVFVVD